jgi:hypothetical protein
MDEWTSNKHLPLHTPLCCRKNLAHAVLPVLGYTFAPPAATFFSVPRASFLLFVNRVQKLGGKIHNYASCRNFIPPLVYFFYSCTVYTPVARGWNCCNLPTLSCKNLASGFARGGHQVGGNGLCWSFSGGNELSRLLFFFFFLVWK